MASQFVHMENFSRRGDKRGRSVSFVLSEARRDPVACVHVPTPRAPAIVWGVDVDEVERQHDDLAAAARASRTDKNGTTMKAIRKDQHTLVTVVASHPYTIDEVEADPVKRREVERWETLNIRWLQQQFGDELKSIIRHTDERHWHLHAYVLPGDPAMKASLLHPGQVAKAAVLASGTRPGEDEKALIKRSDHAYKAAMRRWQDEYHARVAVPCGLTRIGPATRRLTRAAWHAEKVQATALKNAVERAAAVEARGQEFVKMAKAAAAEAAVKAAREKAAADQAAAVARREREKADKASAVAVNARRAAIDSQRAAERLKGLGGRFRAFVDGLRISKVRIAIAAEFSARFDQAQRLLSAVRGDLDSERTRRREAEKRASASTAAVRALAAQRDNAWHEIQTLRARYEPATQTHTREYKP